MAAAHLTLFPVRASLLCHRLSRPADPVGHGIVPISRSSSPAFDLNGCLATNVRELEEIQQDIKQYRPWFDDSVRHLSILKRLTEVFPEDGTITAKNIEVRDGFLVDLHGDDQGRRSFIQDAGPASLHPECERGDGGPTRGEASRQFSFNFHWGEKTEPWNPQREKPTTNADHRRGRAGHALPGGQTCRHPAAAILEGAVGQDSY